MVTPLLQPFSFARSAFKACGLPTIYQVMRRGSELKAVGHELTALQAQAQKTSPSKIQHLLCFLPKNRADAANYKKTLNKVHELETKKRFLVNRINAYSDFTSKALFLGSVAVIATITHSLTLLSNENPYAGFIPILLAKASFSRFQKKATEFHENHQLIDQGLIELDGKPSGVCGFFSIHNYIEAKPAWKKIKELEYKQALLNSQLARDYLSFLAQNFCLIAAPAAVTSNKKTCKNLIRLLHPDHISYPLASTMIASGLLTLYSLARTLPKTYKLQKETFELIRAGTNLSKLSTAESKILIEIQKKYPLPLPYFYSRLIEPLVFKVSGGKYGSNHLHLKNLVQKQKDLFQKQRALQKKAEKLIASTQAPQIFSRWECIALASCVVFLFTMSVTDEYRIAASAAITPNKKTCKNLIRFLHPDHNRLSSIGFSDSSARSIYALAKEHCPTRSASLSSSTLGNL